MKPGWLYKDKCKHQVRYLIRTEIVNDNRYAITKFYEDMNEKEKEKIDKHQSESNPYMECSDHCENLDLTEEKEKLRKRHMEITKKIIKELFFRENK